jgi:hypothetical protein
LLAGFLRQHVVDGVGVQDFDQVVDPDALSNLTDALGSARLKERRLGTGLRVFEVARLQPYCSLST